MHQDDAKPQTTDPDTLDEPNNWAKGCGCPTGCMVAAGIACFLLAALVLGGGRLASRLYFGYRSPGYTARFDDLLNKKLSFPAAWSTPTPFSARLTSGVAELSRANQIFVKTAGADLLSRPPVQREFAALQHGDAITSETWTTFTSIIADATPLLDVTSSVVHLPEYEMGVSAGSYFFGGSKIPHWSLGKLASLRAHSAARQADWENALQFAMMPLLEAQGHPVRSVSDSLMTRELVRQGSDCLADIATSAPDRMLLEHVLTELVRMKAAVINDSGLPGSANDSIAQLRYIAASGYSVPIETGKSSYSYYMQMMREVPSFWKWQIPQLAVGSPERVLLEKHVRETDDIPQLHVSLNTILTLSDMITPELFMLPKLVDMDDLFGGNANEVLLAEERYDLATLRVAQRLAELDGLTTGVTQAELEKRYIRTHLMDPASGHEYMQQPSTGKFYGLGPDKKDDGLKKQYQDLKGIEGDVTVPSPLPDQSDVAI